jgi:hypothetical protein
MRNHFINNNANNTHTNIDINASVDNFLIKSQRMKRKEIAFIGLKVCDTVQG